MTLGHVRQLVAEHGGQLVPAGDNCHQPQVQSKIAAGQRKRVDRTVFAHHDFPGKAFVQLGAEVASQPCRRQQQLPDALHILGHHRVVNVVRVAVDFTRNAVAHASLVARRHVAAVAQVR